MHYKGSCLLYPESGLCCATSNVRFGADIQDSYATSVLRTPSALIARCSINLGSRSPVATTLTMVWRWHMATDTDEVDIGLVVSASQRRTCLALMVRSSLLWLSTGGLFCHAQIGSRRTCKVVP